MNNEIKKIVVEIETENAAFQDGNFDYEVTRILKNIVNDIEERGTSWSNYCDTNGNVVCRVKAIK
jgi:hypothetical protein